MRNAGSDGATEQVKNIGPRCRRTSSNDRLRLYTDREIAAFLAADRPDDEVAAEIERVRTRLAETATNRPEQS
jgi:hypothetical protein